MNANGPKHKSIFFLTIRQLMFLWLGSHQFPHQFQQYKYKTRVQLKDRSLHLHIFTIKMFISGIYVASDTRTNACVPRRQYKETSYFKQTSTTYNYGWLILAQLIRNLTVIIAHTVCSA